MNKLLTSAYLSRYNPKKDKSVSIVFETEEKNAEQIGELHNMVGMVGYLCFKPESQLTTQEIKDIDDMETELGGKTKAQRLRSVIYLLHLQQGKGDFKDYYSEKMEELITHFKTKLE